MFLMGVEGKLFFFLKLRCESSCKVKVKQVVIQKAVKHSKQGQIRGEGRQCMVNDYLHRTSNIAIVTF